jgi:hypothetical protein
MSTVAELSEASDVVLRKVISGELTILEARGMAQLIADRRAVLLVEEQEKRHEEQRKRVKAELLRIRDEVDARRGERSKDDVPPAA